MRTAAAWSFPCGGCFLPGGTLKQRAFTSCTCRFFCNPLAGGLFLPGGTQSAGRCCSNPPARVSLTFAQKKTASVSLHQRFFHGRGWITQAAHLKRPRRAFCRRDVWRRPMLFESTLESETSGFYKTKSPAYFHTLSIFGGRGWIRTTEAEKQQIYSLSPLATREHAHILFVSVAGRLA